MQKNQTAAQILDLKNIHGLEAFGPLPAVEVPAQLALFEDYAAEIACAEKKKKPRDKGGLTAKENLFLRYIVERGLKLTPAYMLSHPDYKPKKIKNAYSKASKLFNQDKIQARYKALLEQAENAALISLTELYKAHKNLVFNGGKGDSVKLNAIDIGLKIHAAKKELPGYGEAVSVNVVNYADGADTK